MTRNPKLSFFVAFAISLAQGEIVLERTYQDKTTGLTFHFPNNWTRDNDSPVFTILSFPPRERPRVVLVPLGGGRLFAISAPQGVTTIEDWLRLDRIQLDQSTHITETKVVVNRYGSIPATLIQSEDSTIPEGRSRSYLFHLNGRLYKIGVFYRGETRVDYFVGVLDAVIKHLELAKAD